MALPIALGLTTHGLAFGLRGSVIIGKEGVTVERQFVALNSIVRLRGDVCFSTMSTNLRALALRTADWFGTEDLALGAVSLFAMAGRTADLALWTCTSNLTSRRAHALATVRTAWPFAKWIANHRTHGRVALPLADGVAALALCLSRLFGRNCIGERARFDDFLSGTLAERVQKTRVCIQALLIIKYCDEMERGGGGAMNGRCISVISHDAFCSKVAR